MTVAALIGVVALLLGVIIGIVIPSGGDSTPAPTATTGGVSAPQLSPEQLESGSLPEGHPDVGDAAPEGSAPATEAP